MTKEIAKLLVGRSIRAGFRILGFTPGKDGEDSEVTTNQGWFWIGKDVFEEAESPEEAADFIIDELRERDSEMNNRTYRGFKYDDC